MFVVTGVTGHTGSVVANDLIEKGSKVRVVVRSEDKGDPFRARGAEVAVADLADGEAMGRAFTGAQGLYLLSPPDLRARDFVGDRRRLFDALAAGVERHRVPHVVLLSSMGAQHPSGTGPIVTLHHAEQVLGSKTALTSVRAAYFLENYGAVLPLARAEGVLPTFMPKEAKIPTVVTPDIGHTAAEALLAGPRGRHVLELSSFDASASDVAAALSPLLGKPVQPSEAPLEAVIPTFVQMGASEEMARLYREMFEAFMRGVTWEGGAAERVQGRTSLEDGLRALLG